MNKVDKINKIVQSKVLFRGTLKEISEMLPTNEADMFIITEINKF